MDADVLTHDIFGGIIFIQMMMILWNMLIVRHLQIIILMDVQ